MPSSDEPSQQKRELLRQKLNQNRQILPLSFAQERMWFLEQWKPNTATYHIHVILGLQGNVHVNILQNCLPILIARHDALRTIFSDIQGKPIQQILSASNVTLDYEDVSPQFSNLPHTTDQQEWQVLLDGCSGHIAKLCLQPFVLNQSPLYRLKLFKCRGQRYILVLVFHHIICDAVSIQIFLQELLQLYTAEILQTPCLLPALHTTYGQYALSLQQIIHTPEYQAQEKYWQQQLAGKLVALDFPHDAEETLQDYASHNTTQKNNLSTADNLPEKNNVSGSIIHNSILKFCQQNQITPFILFLTVFQALLYRYLKQSEFLIATPVSQRTQAQISNLFGLILNTIILRLPIAGCLQCQELLSQNRQTCFVALANSDYPIEKLLPTLDFDRNAHQNPLFQIMFDMQETSHEIQQCAGLVIQTLPCPDIIQQPAKFDLHLSISQETSIIASQNPSRYKTMSPNPDQYGAISPNPDQYGAISPNPDQYGVVATSDNTKNCWKLRWQFNPLYVDSRMVQSLNRDFATMLVACIETPQARIDDIRLASATQNYIFQFSTLYPNITPAQSGSTPKSDGSAQDILPDIPKPQPHFDIVKLTAPASNTTQISTPQPLITELIALQAQRTPDALAVIFESHSINYRDLMSLCQRLAQLWKNYGATSDSIIAVCLPRSLELPTVLLSILFAGATYWPIDPETPGERLSFMLQEAKPVFLVTCNVWIERLKHLAQGACPNLPIFDLTRVWFFAGNLVNVYPLPNIFPDQGAYLIYTSGSTGKPKGVMNSHRGLANRLQWMQEVYHLTEQDRVLQKTTYTFDVSVWEFFWPLLAGATLVMARPGGQSDPTYLADLIIREQITILHFVPSMLSVFLEEPNISKITSLRYVICSGEALPLDVLQRAQSRLVGNIENLYGPTEAAIDVTYWSCTGREGHIVPIGYPIANTQIYIVDHNLDPMPEGMIGEIAIAGIGLARGYQNRPDFTAEKFVPNSLATTPGERMYLTGDLGRIRKDKSIEFLGRRDFQVKWRGFRIELTEIEIALRRYMAVHEAVVVLREDSANDPRLVAYVVLHPQQSVTAQELRAFLKQTLNSYMLPSHFVFLDKLPLTANGKLDRRSLPNPQTASIASSTNKSDGQQSDPKQSISKTTVNTLRIIPIADDDTSQSVSNSSQSIAQAKITKTSVHYPKPIQQPIQQSTAEQPNPVTQTGVHSPNSVSQTKIYRPASTKPTNSSQTRVYHNASAILPSAANTSANTSQPEKISANPRVATTRLKPNPVGRDSGWLENLITQLFEQILHHQPIQRQDDFFELGGHSLLAVQVVRRLQQLLGLDIPIQLVFQAHTPIAIAQQLKELLTKQHLANISQIEFRPTGQQEGPLALAQQPIWLFESLNPGTCVYHMPLILQIQGPLDLPCLQHAWSLLVQRHSILRTTFSLSQPIQHIVTGEPAEWTRRSWILDTHTTESGLFATSTLPLATKTRRIAESATLSLLPSETGRTNQTIKSGATPDKLKPNALATTKRPVVQPSKPIRPSGQSPQISTPTGAVGQSPQISTPTGAVGQSPQISTPTGTAAQNQFGTATSSADHAGITSSQISYSGILDKAIEEKIATWIRTPFQLEQGPLFRLGLIQTGEQEFILVLVLHHIICDGWSLHILYQEWLACYNALVQNKNWNPPPLPIQYLDIAQAQKDWTTPEVFSHYRHYWATQLRDLEPFALPWDFPQLTAPSRNSARCQLVLSADLLNTIRQVSRLGHTTEFVTLLAGFQIALAYCTGQSTAMVAVPFSGRTSAELENIVGMFVNNLVIVCPINFAQSLSDFLYKLSSTLATAIAYQDMPLDLVLDQPILRPRGNHKALVPITFDQVGIDDQQTEFVEATGLTIKPCGEFSLDSKLDLSVYVRNNGHSYTITAIYNTNLFTNQTIQNLLTTYHNILKKLDLSRQLQALIPNSLGTDLPKVYDKCPSPQVAFEEFRPEHIEQSISARFGQMVRKYSTELAVVSDHQSWTYTELNRQANRIAQRIAAFCLPQQSSIALLAGHHPITIAAILAVLQTGHLYVPLDPNYPLERLSYILVNSEAKLLLCESKYAHLALQLTDTNNLDQALSYQQSLPNPPKPEPQQSPYLQISQDRRYQNAEQPNKPEQSPDIALAQLIAFKQDLEKRQQEGVSQTGNAPNRKIAFHILEETSLSQNRPPRMSFLSPVGELELEGLEISTPQQPIHVWDQTIPLIPLAPDFKAYILYTSGSTGRPKGVLQNHRNVLHFISAYTNNLHIHQADRLTLISSYTFDAAIMDIFSALLNGASLYLMNLKEVGLSGLSERIIRHQITIYHSTPTVYHSLLSLVPSDQQFTSVRLVVMGGEPVQQHDIELYRQHFGNNCLFVNGLGPTESTVSFQFILDKNTTIKGNVVPVGYPVAETDLVLLDPDGRPCHLQGEIAIRSLYVALGYWKDETGTRNSFLPVPQHPKLRIYRTGDMGRISPDYGLIFTGRRDWQIKIRGIRIEPAEIETVIRSHPLVQQVVIIDRDVGNETVLVAYIVLSNTKSKTKTVSQIKTPPAVTCATPPQVLSPVAISAPTSSLSPAATSAPTSAQSATLSWDEDEFIATLRQSLQSKLPDFMIPAYWVILPELPLTPNGKLDRKALPPPKSRIIARQLHTSGQDNPIEDMVAGLAKDLLRLSYIHPECNFFNIGASSVFMLQLTGRISQVFGVTIPLSVAFEVPTVRALSRYIYGQIGKQSATNLQKIDDIKITWSSQHIPLSMAQKRLWFLQQLQPQSSAYYITAGVEFYGPHHLGNIQKSLAIIQQRHEVLRMTFHNEDGEPYAVLHNQLPFQLVIANQSHIDATVLNKRMLRNSNVPIEYKNERQAKFDQLLVNWLRRPIDLIQGPLIRFLFVELNVGQAILVMVIHHLISDGWSLGVFLQEFATIYAGLCKGKPCPLPALTIQYSHYIAWQKQFYTQEWQTQELAFWKEYLAGIPDFLEFPQTMPRNAFSSSNGARHSFKIPQKIIADLQKAIGPQTSMFMAFFTAFAILLYQETNQKDIVIGTPIAGRSMACFEPLIGMFVNTVAIRLKLRPSGSLSEFLDTARQSILEVYHHLEIPFDRVVEAVSVGRHWNRTPIFQVMLAFQNTPMPDVSQSIQIRPYPLPVHAVKFDLTLVVIPTEPDYQRDVWVQKDWECRWEYNADVFLSSSALGWSKDFIEILNQMIQNFNPTQNITQPGQIANIPGQATMTGGNFETPQPNIPITHQQYMDTPSSREGLTYQTPPSQQFASLDIPTRRLVLHPSATTRRINPISGLDTTKNSMLPQNPMPMSEPAPMLPQNPVPMSEPALTTHSSPHIVRSTDNASNPLGLPIAELTAFLTTIWQDVLHVRQVKPSDNFFDLGGHSLLLIKVHQRLQRQLPFQIELLDLLKYPNITSLAQFLSKRSSQPAIPEPSSTLESEPLNQLATPDIKIFPTTEPADSAVSTTESADLAVPTTEPADPAVIKTNEAITDNLQNVFNEAKQRAHLRKQHHKPAEE